MTKTPVTAVILDDDARRFLKRTGVVVVALEAAVLAAIWVFQTWFGR
jgi:hypothetical protein